MPVHDWTKVDDGIFHAFHFQWIAAISSSLNSGLLPKDYYALPEQRASDYEPDILALRTPDSSTQQSGVRQSGSNDTALLSRPRFAPSAEADFYQAKQNAISIRHISDDDVVAVIEIVSPGNKSGRLRLDRFVEKSANLLSRQIHLLLIDIHPPGTRDPRGIHAEIWEVAGGNLYVPPPGKPLTQVAYEANEVVSAYVVPLAVGDELTEMPLFLKRQGCIHVPLEKTYLSAFEALPKRWKDVLER